MGLFYAFCFYVRNIYMWTCCPGWYPGIGPCWRRMRRWRQRCRLLLYPLAERSCREWLRLAAGWRCFRGMYPLVCGGNGVPGNVSGGLVSFAVRPTGRRRLYRRRGPDAHGPVSGPDGGGFLCAGYPRQFISNDRGAFRVGGGYVLSVCLLQLVGLLMKAAGPAAERRSSGSRPKGADGGTAVGTAGG